MKRVFNYTNRYKIPRALIDLTLQETTSGRIFKLSPLDPRSITGASGDESVYVEAYYENTVMRFAFGTLNAMHAPASTSLEDLSGTQIIYFRVKIVDESGNRGKIIAIADRISIFTNDKFNNTETLLPVNFRDTGDEVWRIAFHDTGPVMEVNFNIPGIQSMVTSSYAFRALVLPQALRSIMTRICLMDQDDSEEEDSWQGKWITFAKQTSSEDRPVGSESEEIEDYIERVCQAFCKKLKAATLLDTFINNPEAAR